ncbi:MAG: DUF4145 domain-containing protein [Blastocatellia bacterium]
MPQKNYLQILWPCPTCHLATLELSSQTLKRVETRKSKLRHKDPRWDRDWEESQFSCFLVCKTCQETVVVAGEVKVEAGPDDEEPYSVIYEDRYIPRFVSPAPRIINIPKTAPPEIQKELQKSFQLYWLDVESCANRIRSCIEALLDYQRVKKTVINKKGKRVKLSLHNRIEEFKKKSSALANLSMAIKWLGNAGSHTSAITRNDIQDACKMMEHLLAEIYDPPAKNLAKMAKQINRSKRPRWAQKKPVI